MLVVISHGYQRGVLQKTTAHISVIKGDNYFSYLNHPGRIGAQVIISLDTHNIGYNNVCYAHLAVQVLGPLSARFSIAWCCLLYFGSFHFQKL